MRRLFFLLLLSNTLSYAQPKLEGTVYLYQEKGSNRALPDVSIKASGSGSLVTKANGYYAFAFDNSIDVTTLTVMKIGYEIINGEDLRVVELKKKQQQNVYLDVEGNTEKRKRELLDAAVQQRKKIRDEYYRVLDEGGVEADKLKKKLEKEAGKTFADVDEVRSYVYEKFGADKEMLDQVVASVIRMNLDHTNKDVEKIKEYTLKGDLKSALVLLDLERGFKETRSDNALMRTITERKLARKEKFLAGIPLLVSNGLYSKVDSVYQLAMLADTTDMEIVFRYAYFLGEQKQFERAIGLYQRYIESLDKEKEYSRATALNSLGILLDDINQKPEAKKHYEEALEILGRLAKKKTEAYESDVAAILNNLGILLDDINQKPEAKKHYEEALEIRRRLASKKPETYDPAVASTLTNLGNLLNSINQKPEARMHYEEALEIRRRLAAKNPEIYEPDVAATLNNLGLLLDSINQKPEAKKHHEEALEIRCRLALKNPDACEPDVAMTLNNLGILLYSMNQKPEARKRYEKALEIYRRLVSKNPGAYESNRANTLNNLGVLLNNINQKSEAKKHYKEALEIYRRLASKNPGAYEPDVARTLNNLGVLLNSINQKPEAKMHYEEALEIRHRLASKNPGAYEPDVAQTLDNLRILLNDMIQDYKRAAKPDSVIRYTREYYDLILLISEADRDFKWHTTAMSALRIIAESYDDLCVSDSAAAYYTKTLHYNNTILLLVENVLKNDRDEDILEAYASYNGSASWYALHAKQAEKAEQYARKALETDPTARWVNTNLAHALLLQNRYGEAEELYRSLKASPYEQDTSKTYAEVLLDDFQQLACSGAIPPEHMAEVERVKAILKE